MFIERDEMTWVEALVIIIALLIGFLMGVY